MVCALAAPGAELIATNARIADTMSLQAFVMKGDLV
jgi:hypothetical protein